MASQKHPSAKSGEPALDGAPLSDRPDPSDRPDGPIRPAVFLDRDGTLIEEKQYLSEPSEIALIPGAVLALARLRDAGFALVLVTNQSAIGRGWLSETKLGEIHTELERRLAEANVKLDAIYFCPDVDAEAAGAGAAQDPQADRKPGAGMLFRAAQELGLDLAASWMIGDHVRDLEAGRHAGCRGNLLVLTGHGETFRAAITPADSICQDLAEAAQHILEGGQSVDPSPNPK